MTDYFIPCASANTPMSVAAQAAIFSVCNGGS